MRLVCKISVLFFLFFVVVNAVERSAKAAEPIPPELEGIGIEEKLGNFIPLDLTFKDEQGKELKLRDFFTDQKPVILNLVYYGCPNLCGFLLNGFVDALKVFTWSPGKEFNVVTVSIDPSEKPALAAQKKEALLKVYSRNGAEAGWHFLTGAEENIKKLAAAVGFKYRYDTEEKQFAHSAAIFVLTPEGKISRYLYGIEFPVRDLKFSLMEATQGKIGSVVDKFLMFCYHYDPKGKKYALMALNLMKLGGAITVLLIFVYLVFQIKSTRTAPKAR